MDTKVLKEEEDIDEICTVKSNSNSKETVPFRGEKQENILQNDHTESTDNQEEKVEEDDSNVKNIVPVLRALLENQDPSSKELEDSTIRRFLRARDLDVQKASSMLLKYLKWRRTFVPNGYISASEVVNEIAQNKVFMQGKDKKGRPIIVVLGSRHFQNKLGGLDEFKRFVVFLLDKLCSSMPHGGEEKFVVIGDLENWGYRNSDIRAYLGSLSILQDYYPERLGKTYLVNAPQIFMTAWKIVYPFIDVKTRSKIVFVEKKRLKTTLLEDIDESQLPEIYGGRLPLVPVQTGYVD